VDDAIDLILGEDLAQEGLVTDIALVETQILAGDVLHTVQGLGIGVAQVIDDHNIVTLVQKLHAGVGADITGTAGDKNFHRKNLLLFLSFAATIVSHLRKDFNTNITLAKE
jgi:hypothetical protein